MATRPYNPLDKLNLARSIKAEILSRSVEAFGKTDGMIGAGVYAIYYRGGFHAYAPLADANRTNWKQPIYVGKAIPKGGRKGGLPDASASSHARLRKHAESIKDASNLDLDDFGFFHIVLDDIWIPLGENILIESFKPLWNVAVEGFGINDPGKGRINQKQSPWDVLHPGRNYAARLTGGGPNFDAVVGRIDDHFASRPLRSLPKALAKVAEAAAEEDNGDV